MLAIEVGGELVPIGMKEEGSAFRSYSGFHTEESPAVAAELCETLRSPRCAVS
jgi:hypothetical protein